MQAVPDAEFLPSAQAPVGGASRATHLGRDILPATTGSQDEPDDFEDGPVPDGRSAAFGSDGSLGGQVVADQIIELIGHVCGGHGR